MKTFKEFVDNKPQPLEEAIVSDLLILTKDLLKIGWSITKWSGRGGLKTVKGLQKRYNKQAIADRKAEKAMKKAARAEKLKLAKVHYVDAKRRLESELKQIAALSKAEKDIHKDDIDKTKKQLNDISKKLNIFAKKNKEVLG